MDVDTLTLLDGSGRSGYPACIEEVRDLSGSSGSIRNPRLNIIYPSIWCLKKVEKNAVLNEVVNFFFYKLNMCLKFVEKIFDKF